jgi:hypothetical protein
MNEQLNSIKIHGINNVKMQEKLFNSSIHCDIYSVN